MMVCFITFNDTTTINVLHTVFALFHRFSLPTDVLIAQDDTIDGGRERNLPARWLLAEKVFGNFYRRDHLYGRYFCFHGSKINKN